MLIKQNEEYSAGKPKRDKDLPSPPLSGQRRANEPYEQHSSRGEFGIA